jgi:hypothetical protein
LPSCSRDFFQSPVAGLTNRNEESSIVGSQVSVHALSYVVGGGQLIRIFAAL